MRVRRPWGGAGRLAELPHKWEPVSSYPRLLTKIGPRHPIGLPVQFEARADFLVAGCLAEIGYSRGYLQRAIKFLFGTECVVSDRIVADGREPGAKGGAGGQDIKFDRPFVAEHLGRRRRRRGWQRH